MSIVDFNTCTWKDPWFRQLSVKAKTLFVFLWTNDHKNLPCLYEIDVETMNFYTGLSKKEILEILSSLYPKVKYDDKKQVVWVVNFVRHQFMRTGNISDKIITGIKNNLVQMNDHFFIKEFLEEYPTLEIIYEYPIDNVQKGYQYPPGGGGGKGKDKEGESEGEKKIKYAEFVFMTEKEYQTLVEKYGSKTTKQMIEVLDNYKGSKGKKYKSDYRAILSWVVEKTGQTLGQACGPPPELKYTCPQCGERVAFLVNIGTDKEKSEICVTCLKKPK